MLKRTSKITALLVAATSIMTMVPAMAADNTRVGNREGTVKQGIAYDNGAYAYYGYRNDTYDTGVWFNKGGDEKDYADTDLADYRFNNDSKYGTKYAYAKENSDDDEYLVDLSTGKIVTDETAEEKSDVAQANLTSKIKKADRYKNVITTTSDLDRRFDQILKGQFGDVWYQYNTNVSGTNNAGSVKGEVEVTANTDWSTLKVGDKTFTKNDSTPVTGYTSAADFIEKARFIGVTPANFAITATDSTTGKITLTQVAAANYTQADANAARVGDVNITYKVTTPGTTGAAVPAYAGQPKQYSMKSATTLTTTIGGTAITALANVPLVSGYSAGISVGNDIITYTEVPDGEGKFTGTTFNAPTLYDGVTKINAVAAKGYKFTTSTTFATVSGGPTVAAPGVPGYALTQTGNVATYTEVAVGGVFAGTAFVAPTLYDGTTKLSAVTNTTGTSGKPATLPVKAVIEITPDLTKDITIAGSPTIYKNAGVVSGFNNAAGFITQLKAAATNGELGNYELKAEPTVSGSTVNFTLVQKVGQTLNGGNVGFGTDGVKASIMVVGVGGTSSNGSTGFTGFADEKGNYVDASYNANMRVYSTVKGRAVMVDKYDDEVEDAGLTVSLDSLEAIAQDDQNIYALAHVTVTGAGTAEANQVFLQKISKAQGGKDAEDAYVPKSVTSYQLDTKNIYDNDDMEDAVKAIDGTLDSDYKYLIGMEVKDGSLYVTRASEDSVKVYKLDMKNVKSDTLVGSLKTDVDTNALVKSDDGDTDIVKHEEASPAEDEGLKGIEKVTDRVTGDVITLAGQDVYRHPAVSIDVDGNTWALDKGQIKMFTKVSSKEVNTCDRAMDAIDAYSTKSVIAWDTDGDAYTTLAEGAKVTETDGINVNPDINKDKFKNGYNATEKKFYKDGVAVVNQWASDDAGKWYFLDANGVAKTGWYRNASGTWYLLNANGAMLTGWKQYGGDWYYLNPVNTSGAMVTGWFKDTTGTWYYTDDSGKMLSNTTVDGYKLGANGALV